MFYALINTSKGFKIFRVIELVVCLWILIHFSGPYPLISPHFAGEKNLQEVVCIITYWILSILFGYRFDSFDDVIHFAGLKAVGESV